MDSPTLALVILSLIVYTTQVPMERLEHFLVYPAEPSTRIQKRETTKNQDDFNSFVEEKLIEHTQALEHLVKLVQGNEDTTKQLVQHLSQNVEEPKMPEKIEVQQPRRSFSIEKPENPLVRLGNNIPKYGIFFRNIIMKEIKNDHDPIPIIERSSSSDRKMSRRSFGGAPVVVPHLVGEPDKPSQWCSVAVLCHRTMSPVCGHDDNFGYGKFDDICHMLQVNCYWGYNFALVPSCKPLV